MMRKVILFMLSEKYVSSGYSYEDDVVTFLVPISQVEEVDDEEYKLLVNYCSRNREYMLGVLNNENIKKVIDLQKEFEKKQSTRMSKKLKKIEQTKLAELKKQTETMEKELNFKKPNK